MKQGETTGRECYQRERENKNREKKKGLAMQRQGKIKKNTHTSYTRCMTQS